MGRVKRENQGGDGQMVYDGNGGLREGFMKETGIEMKRTSVAVMEKSGNNESMKGGRGEIKKRGRVREGRNGVGVREMKEVTYQWDREK